MNYTKRNCIKKISTSQKMQYFEKKKNLTLWACVFRQVAITLGLRNSQKGFSAAFNCSTDLQPALGSVHTSAFYLCSTLARCVWNEVFLMTWNATAYRFKKHKCEWPLLYMPFTSSPYLQISLEKFKASDIKIINQRQLKNVPFPASILRFTSFSTINIKYIMFCVKFCKFSNRGHLSAEPLPP